MEFPRFNIKKISCIFSKEGFFLFREMETPKNSLYFRKRNFISENETF